MRWFHLELAFPGVQRLFAGNNDMSKVPVALCTLSRSSVDDLVRIDQIASPVPWNSRQFAGEFSNPNCVIFGARAQGQLVGYAACHKVVDEVHIQNIAVHKSFQGQGIGRALMVYLLGEFYSQTFKWATLEVRESNRVARGLYESLGFKEVGSRGNYYSDTGETAVLMTLDLEYFTSQRS